MVVLLLTESLKTDLGKKLEKGKRCHIIAQDPFLLYVPFLFIFCTSAQLFFFKNSLGNFPKVGQL